ncbi:MAG: HlyD family efflux transporter periplasmic adaptor subunit, partial [Planctomycetes bacterium]|nr:HlyD family efflux transporter periplasmic adaptor subunit [Planctomycetota bacterium]
DVALLEARGVAYGVAWRGVVRPPNVLVRTLESNKWRKIAVAAILFVAALGLIRVPLRIVAPCEVAPRDPVVVAAPLNGVIDEIPVWPGRSVEVGDLLAIYDKRVATEELKVARQQVEIIKSDLQRSRVQAFDSPAERSRIKLLENRLEQEKTRLGIAQYRVDKLEVRAPVRGTLMFADPHEWRGRPVQVGERLMMIVDPERTKLRIWLPGHDNINFDRDKPLTVILDSDPSSSRTARLSFVANHSQMNPDGVTCFRAEAEWIQGPSNIKMGLQGTAILFGERVSLGYWLLRRPLAALRRFIGI